MSAIKMCCPQLITSRRVLRSVNRWWLLTRILELTVRPVAQMIQLRYRNYHINELDTPSYGRVGKPTTAVLDNATSEPKRF